MDRIYESFWFQPMIAYNFTTDYSTFQQKVFTFPDFANYRTWIPNLFILWIGGLSAILFSLLRLLVQRYYYQVAIQYRYNEPYRFSESSWKFWVYFCSFLCGFYIVLQGNYYPETANCWDNWPNIPRFFWLDLYYVLQLGFYIHSIWACLTIENKRKDFILLLIHHIITLWLIWASYVFRFERIGMLVLICHDVSDIFLEWTKTLNYAKVNDFYQIVGYLMVLITWMVTRLGIFPFQIIWSSLIESCQFLPVDQIFPIFLLFNLCLMILFLMHIYWWFLIIRIGYRKLQGHELKDDRDDVVTNKRKH